MTESERERDEDGGGRRGRRILGAVFKLAALLLVVGGLAAAWLLTSVERSLHTPLALPEEGIVFDIEPGTSLRQVATTLHASGVLDSPYFLVWHARWHDKAGAIKAGEYEILPGTTPLQMLEQFIEGRVVQHSLTLVEGWTFQQVMSAVNAHDALEHTLDGLEPAEIMARLGHPNVHPEGRFFADTYHFPRSTTDVEFLHRAYRTMEHFLANAWRERSDDLPLETPEEALILASIVEKETAVAHERARIAGVFLRRLRKGMRLETDPTVIYGLGERFDGNLRRVDLRRDTPYNTYVHKGLPPTPIAMPGAAAIEAVLHPEPGDALYFVAKGDGSHHFSATYDEHRRAVARYQKRRRSAARNSVAND